ncbi:MAG: HNH endonuclease, partial [Helicobacter sp.]|nr:HNH endonuclease [Helicobacter sp.]
EKLAEQWTIENKEGKEWSAQDVREYRKENNLTWHERSDMKTLDLVPQEIHGNVPHSGGISACKNKIRGVA